MKPFYNEKNRALNEVNREDKSLTILHDWGYDSGEFSHIKVYLGIVDVRTLSSEINVEDGYQRTLTDDRTGEIVSDYHKSKLDVPTISLRSGRKIVDGQFRINSVKYLFEKGIIDDPMIPCKILKYATKGDECVLFGEQDNGKSHVSQKEKTRSLVNSGKRKIYTDLNEFMIENGMTLFKTKKGQVPFSAHSTLVKYYNNESKEVVERVIYTISRAFDCGRVHNATSEIMFKMLVCFYKEFPKADDDLFIEKLKKTTPDTLLEESKKYKSKLDSKRQYLKPLVFVYNKSRRTDKINYL